MAPMILLYFVSIGLSYIAYAGRKQNKDIDPSTGPGQDGRKNADEDAAV
jgi:Sec-independent protein secretion pathway component TatC